MKILNMCYYYSVVMYGRIVNIPTGSITVSCVLLYNFLVISQWNYWMRPIPMFHKMNQQSKSIMYADLSLQLYTQRKQSLKIRPEKKFRPERDSNPWPLWYRCSALPTEVSSHRELVTLWVCNIPVKGEYCKWIYERSYTRILNCGERYEFIIDCCSNVIHTT